MDRLDDLFAALTELADERSETKATSVRQPVALHRAVQVATELGMDESYTAAANRALEERIRAFARQQALAAHFRRFPEDRPRLAAVALRRIAGSGHPGERLPDVVERLPTGSSAMNRIGWSPPRTRPLIRCYAMSR